MYKHLIVIATMANVMAFPAAGNASRLSQKKSQKVMVIGHEYLCVGNGLTRKIGTSTVQVRHLQSTNFPYLHYTAEQLVTTDGSQGGFFGKPKYDRKSVWNKVVGTIGLGGIALAGWLFNIRTGGKQGGI